MFSTFRSANNPPQHISQLRVDMAVARSISLKREGGQSQSHIHHTAHRRARTPISRQRSVSLPLYSNQTTPNHKKKQTGYTPKRAKPERKVPASAHMPREVLTPTKQTELLHIRDKLATDKHYFTSSYPVPPSPMRINGATPEVYTTISPPYAHKLNANTHISPSPLRSPSKSSLHSSTFVSGLEKDLDSVRRELEAEKQHSEALRQQAMSASSALDVRSQKFKGEVARLEALVKKAEATAALAVADREQIRVNMATEVSDLKRELSQKTQEVRETKLRLEEALRAPPPPPTPPPPPPHKNPHGYPLPKPVGNAMRSPEAAATSIRKQAISWNPKVEYREASPELDTPEMPTPATDSSGDEVDADLIRDLRDMFRENDTENVGWISQDKVMKAFSDMEKTFGLEPCFEAALEKKFGKSCSKDLQVDFNDFVEIMSILPTRLATETVLCFDEGDEEEGDPLDNQENDGILRC